MLCYIYIYNSGATAGGRRGPQPAALCEHPPLLRRDPGDTHTHTHAHTHAHTRTHARTHARTRAHTHIMTLLCYGAIQARCMMYMGVCDI